MNAYRADLHIHTLLSPCAGLEMTPRNIVRQAREARLDIIGITDHNSTRHAPLIEELARETGIFVLTGAEVTTREEVHCLVFFEQRDQLMLFQAFLEKHSRKIPNDEAYFGYQPVIDRDENILEMIPYYLPASLTAGINEVRQFTDKHHGIFIPAHIDRTVNGILSQLGFIPESLKCDALGLSGSGSEADVRKRHVIQNKLTFIYNSDAHYLTQIGEIYSVFNMEDKNFSEIRMALNNSHDRYVG